MENWKPVVGFEGIYEVSDLGCVRSVVDRKNSYAGKILIPRIRSNGYRQYSLTDMAGKTKYCKGSRLVASAFLQNPESKPQVNHINGIKQDDRVENLEWTTASENQLHALRMGLSAPKRGEEQRNSVLKESEVRKIRSLLCNGEHPKKIGQMFDVHKTTIFDIKWGRTWAWLE